MTRRALVIHEPGTIRLVERPSLDPGNGEAVVSPVYTGVCGTDLELLHGEVDPSYVRYPLTIGHEWAGVVVRVGDGVTSVAPGDRVVVEGIIPCGACRNCISGATNLCLVYDELGFTREGGASDEVLVPARVIHKLAAGVSLLDACLVEPAAVVLRALEKARPVPGQQVLIVGDGTIGLLAASLVALWSPAEVVMLGRRREQATLASNVGVDRFTVDDNETKGSFDLVIEAAGAAEAVATAIRAGLRGATILLIGLPPAGRSIELPGDLLVNNDLTVTASFSYTSASWGRVVDLLNARRIEPSRIVTHRFPLDRFEEAFAALRASEGERGKVVLEVSQAA